MNLSFSYPIWFLLPCVLLGVLYSFALYYRDMTFKDTEIRFKKFIWLLAIIRFMMVTLIALFLLSPLLKMRFTQIEKPIIIIAQDNSKSIRQGFFKNDSSQYVSRMNELIAALEKDFSVRKYSFGEQLREQIDFKFNDKLSNISQPLDEIYNAYTNQNVGAILIASDGLYNAGSNPLYGEKKLTAPIYSIALGDTTEKRDLLISKSYYNQIVYLGDKFNLKIEVSAKNCNGEPTTLSVATMGVQNFESLQKKNISIKGNYFDTSASFILSAEKKGIQHYRVVVSQVKDEITTANNVQDIFIEVLDSRQKILLLANSPHPDLSAIKQAIEINKNYEVKLIFANNFVINNFSIKEYNLIILHQLPSPNQDVKPLLEKIKTENIPTLFIIGLQTSIPFFNTSQQVMQITSKSNNFNQVQAVFEKDFSLFGLSDVLKSQVQNLPPLVVPFGEFKTIPNVQNLFIQRIGSVTTSHPLLVFNQNTGNKTGILCGEGIWRWRLHDFLQNKNQDAINELVGKTVQYLSVKADTRQFRVLLSKRNFSENENLNFDAELYDESFQLLNTPDAELKIINSDGKEFPFVFNKNEKSYSLNVGYFPVGSYSYEAKVRYNSKDLVARGEFSIAALQLEDLQTTASHQLLYLLSEQTGGEVFYPSNLSALADLIKRRESIKPISYSTYKTQSFINLKWIFFLLLTLLSVEWFVRKWNGVY